MTLDATHNPLAQSCVESANDPASDFPIQNLPFGRFRLGHHAEWRAGVAIGEHVLDLQEAGLLDSTDIAAVMDLSAAERHALRHRLFEGLHAGSHLQSHWELALFVQSEVEIGLLQRVPKAYLTDAHHWLILHGRYVCQARKPLCWQCGVSAHCDFKDKTPRP